MSQNRLREFVNNSGVQVQRESQRMPQLNNQNIAEIFPNNNSNVPNYRGDGNNVPNYILNYVVGGTPLMFTPLQYTNFNATITYSGRPKNVLQFVKNTKPRAGDYVDKISARYGRFKEGARHTRNVGFRFHQNVNANTAKNIKWSSIEFLVSGKNGGSVRVIVYENVIQMTGGIIGDPLNIAKYIVKTYFKQDPEFVNDITYSKIDARFKFNAKFLPSAVSQSLVSNSIEHSYEPELFPTEIKDIKYKGIVINSIKSTGFVHLHNATSKEQMERMYALAKEFVQRLLDKNVLTITNAPPVTPQKKKRKNVNVTTPENIRRKRLRSPQKQSPRITRMGNNTNILVNALQCQTLPLWYIKEKICKPLGIVGKKGWKKEDYCKAALDKKQNTRNNTIIKNRLYREAGVDNNSIRRMLGRNEGIQYVRTSTRIKKDKKGVPIKTYVEKVAKVVGAAQSALNRFNNINANMRNKILNKVKNVNTTPKAVKDMVRRHVEIHRLTNLNAIEKGKIYEDLKNKKNVNVTRYANLYKLIRNSRTPNSVKNKVINWMKNKNTLPTNENVRNKLRSYAR